MKNTILILFLFVNKTTFAQTTYKPDEHGHKLKEFYLSLNVENLWIAGQHINWETGVADNPDATHNIKTHCSAFAAAACKKLNIYILRPSEHAQGLLANAQYDWLKTPEAGEKGWKHIETNNRYQSAQTLANKGFVVVAVIQNPDPHRPGHTALVTPATITNEQLAESGPKLIMAGTKNYNYVSLKTGFKNHLDAWPENQIEFYYYKDSAF